MSLKHAVFTSRGRNAADSPAYLRYRSQDDLTTRRIVRFSAVSCANSARQRYPILALSRCSDSQCQTAYSRRNNSRCAPRLSLELSPASRRHAFLQRRSVDLFLSFFLFLLPLLSARSRNTRAHTQTHTAFPSFRSIPKVTSSLANLAE